MKCKYCEQELTPEQIGRNHYIARYNSKNILLCDVSEFYYDAFDCPICKCQNVLGKRYKRHITLVSENIPDEVVFVEKEIKNVPKCFSEYTDKNIACVEKCDLMQQCKRAKLYGCFSYFEQENDTCMNDCEFSELCKIRTKGVKK